MKNYVNNIIVVLSFAILGIFLYTCEDTSDDYLKYVEDGEILYIGKVNGLQSYSGLNRIQILGELPSDPKASEIRIYWNNKRDSVVVNIDRSINPDTFSTIIDGLDENIYSFEVVTFDAEGNRSVASNVNGQSYGQGYIATLFNRPITSSSAAGENLDVVFADIDQTGFLGVELTYTATDDTEKTIFIDKDDDPAISITDFKAGSSFSYRSAYIPAPTAIDIFYSASVTVTPRPFPVLKNASQPFESVAGQTGRWRTLAAPWITNDAAKSHVGRTVGGYDNGCCGNPVSDKTFNLECGWGEPPFTNAKIHQVTTADFGKTYQLRVVIGDTNYSGGSYIVVALGDGLPDVSQVTTAPNVLAYHLITSTGTKTLDFSLTEVSQISVGQVSTQSGDRYCNIRGWEIIEK